MILQHLVFRFQQGTLNNSWLIDTNNPEKALIALQDFIQNNLLKSNIALESHPDYICITKEESPTATTKNISVDQIRNLQEFLNKTSIISGYKIAVIYQAHLMTLNAANSCLKILEDSPKNSYIFLITSKAASIIDTIKSRCAKINAKSQGLIHEEELYKEFTSSIANCSNINVKLELIQTFSDKNRELWTDLARNTLCLINRMIKNESGINIKLTEEENAILNRLKNKSPTDLIEKFANIRHLVHNTIDYDLDLRASSIVLLEELF